MPDPWAVVSTKPAQDEWAVVSTRPAPKEENKPLGWRDEILRFWRPLSPEEQKGITQRLGNIAGPAAIGFSNTAMGTAEGAANLLLHPLGSIWGTAQTAADALNQLFPDSILNPKQKAAKQASLDRLKDQWEQIKTNPDYAMGNLAGAILGADVASEAIGPVTRGLKEKVATAKGLPGNAIRTFAGTGAKTTAKLVEDVKAANQAADAYSNLQAKIETARNNALKVGNEKYNAVNEKLNPLPVNMETIRGAVEDARSKLKGSDKVPAILKDIQGKVPDTEPSTIKYQGADIPKGHPLYDVLKEQGAITSKPLTYSDLQGYYSELGKEISKGTLQGDEYTALDTLHEQIGDEMQRIADSQGAGEQLTQARNYWRRMKQTFGKPYNATDAASSVLTQASPEMAQQAATANRVRLLGYFDPEIPATYNELLKNAEKAKKTGVEAVPGETRKVNESDIRGRKKESAIVSKVPHIVRSTGYRLGTLWPLIDAVRDAIRGEIPSVGGLAGGTVAVAGGAHLLGALLENPKVVDFLTKATAKDIAEVPDDLRGDLPRIVKTAQGRGIKVSPALAALVGSGAAIGPKTQSLQKTADEYRNAASQ